MLHELYDNYSVSDSEINKFWNEGYVILRNVLDEEEINESDLKALAALIKASAPHTKSEINESLRGIRKRLARMVVLSESVDPTMLTEEHRLIFLRKINAINGFT